MADYVVTEQLAKEFDKALRLVRGAVRKNASYAAYLHGSFGAGKSHFLTVLHAVLNGDPAARAKPRLREVVGEHNDWLPGKKFLMVPYHLIGAANLDSALLDGYVRAVRAERPDASTPAVYKSDALLADARAMRESLGDEAFARLLPTTGTAAPAAPRTPVADDGLAPIADGLAPIGSAPADGGLAPIGSATDTPWTGAELDAPAAGLCLPDVSSRAVRGLKFGEALPPRLAEATLAARLTDEKSAGTVLAEPARFLRLGYE